MNIPPIQNDGVQNTVSDSKNKESEVKEILQECNNLINDQIKETKTTTTNTDALYTVAAPVLLSTAIANNIEKQAKNADNKNDGQKEEELNDLVKDIGDLPNNPKEVPEKESEDAGGSLHYVDSYGVGVHIVRANPNDDMSSNSVGTILLSGFLGLLTAAGMGKISV